jgi:uncharacterized protein YcfJ
MKKIVAIIAAFAFGFFPVINVEAQDTLFGPAGSGQPTKTVIGILGGAAAGAALGKGLGGKDGWWLGSLTGATVGGMAGNLWGASNQNHVRTISYAQPKRVEHIYVTQPVCNTSIPYGYLNSGLIKSPWSDFTMSVGGKVSGQIVYDPNTGQPFKIP